MSGVHLRRRVTKNGEIRWMCVYRVGGRYGRIRSAGTFPTQKLARARAELVWAEIAAGHARQSMTADVYSHVVLEPGDLEPVAWEET